MSTTAPALRPLGIGDILDRAVRIYRSNFVTLISIIAVISVPLLLIQVLAAGLTLPWTGGFTGGALAGDSAAGLFTLAQGVTALVAAFAAIFQVGAISAFVAEQLKGNTLTLREAYGRAFRRGVSLFIATVLIALVYVALSAFLFVPFIVIFAAANLGGSADNALLGVVVLLLCCLFIPLLLGFLYLSVRWMFYNQAIVLEDYNSTGGLGRSWKLVKGKFWRTLGFYIILAILVTAFTAGPVYLLTILSVLLPSLALSTIVSSVAQTLLQVIILPIQYIALTLYYFDLRVRQEGYDLQLQLEQGQGTDALPPLFSREPGEPRQDPDALPPVFPPDTGSSR